MYVCCPLSTGILSLIIFFIALSETAEKSGESPEGTDFVPFKALEMFKISTMNNSSVEIRFENATIAFVLYLDRK